MGSAPSFRPRPRRLGCCSTRRGVYVYARFIPKAISHRRRVRWALPTFGHWSWDLSSTARAFNSETSSPAWRRHRRRERPSWPQRGTRPAGWWSGAKTGACRGERGRVGSPVAPTGARLPSPGPAELSGRASLLQDHSLSGLLVGALSSRSQNSCRYAGIASDW